MNFGDEVGKFPGRNRIVADIGGDDVGRAQLFGPTGPRVARIADGGGCQDQDTTATGAA